MKNLNMSKNEEMIIEAFNRGRVDEEHYEKGYALYRFSAFAKLNYENDNNIQEKVSKFLERLDVLDIRPERIFLWGGKAEIDWTPRAHQCVESREDYLRLALEFARFIDEIGSYDMEVNTGSFWDDANLVPDNETHKGKYKTKFNKECFDWQEEITIYDCIKM